jgi:hypothetical protein
METKRKPLSTGFEKHPDPKIEESREAFRQKWGFNPAMPHVTLVPSRLRVDVSKLDEKPETTAEVSK